MGDLAQIVARLASIGGADDAREPRAIFQDVDACLRDLAAETAFRDKTKAIARTTKALGEAREEIRRRGVAALPKFREAVEAHRKALDVPISPPPRRRYGLEAVMADCAPPPTVCRKLEWEVGRTPMIIGPPSAGKSFIVQAAILDLVMGRSLWGCPDFHVPRPCRVLFFDLDQGSFKTRWRFKRLLRGIGAVGSSVDDARRELAAISRRPIDNLGSFEVDPGDGLRLLSLDATELSRWSAAWTAAVSGFDVAFVDSLRRLAPFLDENDSRFSLVPDTLRLVSEAAGCVIVLLHHASNKARPSRGGGQPPPAAGTRGSSAIDGAAGTQLLVEEEDEARRVTQTRAGDAAKLAPFYLAFEDDPPAPDGIRPIRVVYKTLEQINAPIDAAKAGQVRAVAQKVIAFVRKENANGRGVASKRAIVEEIPGKDSTIYAAIDLLLEEHSLVDVPVRDALGKKRSRFWCAAAAPGAAHPAADPAD